MIREVPPTAGLPLELADFLPASDELEASLASRFGLPAPLVTSSGAGALWIALEALKSLRPERRVVVVPAFTCPLVALAVAQAGLEPRLCDTRPGHFDLDLESLRDQCGADTLAVITTHLGGRIADAVGAAAIARAAGAFLIEDAAQALGAYRHGESLGLAGDVGFFSLGAGKGLSIYSGGLVVSRDGTVRAALEATQARLVRAKPWLEAWRSLQTIGLWAAYQPFGLWFAYGQPLRRALADGDLIGALSERFAPEIRTHRVGRWRRGVGANAARRLQPFLDAGRERALLRIPRFEAIPGITVLQDGPEDAGTWPYFLLRLPNTEQRDRVLADLWPAGLGVSRAFCHALPDYPELRNFLGDADVPNARDFAARTLTVTNSPWLRDEELARICAALEAAIA